MNTIYIYIKFLANLLEYLLMNHINVFYGKNKVIILMSVYINKKYKHKSKNC